MKHEIFNSFLQEILKEVEEVLTSKSADYSNNDDKLYNFMLASQIDGISPIESLRGMWLKHRTSINQGLDEIDKNYATTRSWKWHKEKYIDSINYTILMLALIKEEYFGGIK